MELKIENEKVSKFTLVIFDEKWIENVYQKFY